MDPDQTAPTLFVFEASNIIVDDKNINFVVMRFRVNKCELSVYTVKCTHVCTAKTTY